MKNKDHQQNIYHNDNNNSKKNYQYGRSKTTMTTTMFSSTTRTIITSLLLVLFSNKNNVICQNDYYEEMANGAGGGTGGGAGDDMIIHSPVASNAISTKLDSLDVICGKEYMTVRAEFNGPFNGIIFSKGTYGQSKCVYVKPHSGLTHATFNVRYDECGTKPDLQGKYFENTIVIQYGTDIIEAYDEAKRLRCEWFEAYEKPATFRPAIPVADLDIIEMNFQGDEIDCWMSIQEGKGPWSNEINRIVTVGQPLTIVVAINDRKNQFDMKVKSCFAHDGVKSPVYLIDEDGCILRPKMISPFQKIRNLKGKASLISYAQFLAFKFPDSVDVQIQCTVEVCRHGCVDTCNDASQQHSTIPSNYLDVPPSLSAHHFHHHMNRPIHQSESRVHIENVTATHYLKEPNDDLLESANTSKNPLIKTPDDISIDVAHAIDNEKQSYLDVIADYLHNVDANKPAMNDGHIQNDYQPEKGPPASPPTPPAILPSPPSMHNEPMQEHVEEVEPNNQVMIEHHLQMSPPPGPSSHGLPPLPQSPPSHPIPGHIAHHAMDGPAPPPPNVPLSSEPIAQVLNIPLSPLYSMPLSMPLTMLPPPYTPPQKASSLGGLLNPFSGIKLFNMKQTSIPQLLSNYFSTKKIQKQQQQQQHKFNYLPNDNFELISHNPTMSGPLYRSRRYINDKQGEIGLRKGFQVVTTLDLSFSPNISQDQMQIFEGKPEAIVYGICFSSTYFIYAIGTSIILLFSGISISIFIVYKLEKIKNKNKCHQLS